jgi:hypothetical protein
MQYKQLPKGPSMKSTGNEGRPTPKHTDGCLTMTQHEEKTDGHDTGVTHRRHRPS